MLDIFDDTTHCIGGLPGGGGVLLNLSYTQVSGHGVPALYTHVGHCPALQSTFSFFYGPSVTNAPNDARRRPPDLLCVSGV